MDWARAVDVPGRVNGDGRGEVSGLVAYCLEQVLVFLPIFARFYRENAAFCPGIEKMDEPQRRGSSMD